MAKYGIPYKGSKSKIADEILSVLPSGKRFVDLFGGGFAMSHAALVSGKYETVLYNDLDPLLVPLIRDAIQGKYNPECFTPEWISRDEFHERKLTDGYVKFVWSFGNNGRSYLFGKDKEEIKRKGHEYAVFGKPFDGIPVVGDTITERRLFLKKLARESGKRFDLRRLQQLQQLERLQQLEQLEQLEPRIELCNMDYREYEYIEGDIVYLDPPYKATNPYSQYSKGEYGKDFDTAAFLDWAATRDFPVFVSEYEIPDARFKLVWEKQVRSTMGAANNNCAKVERLYRTK